MKLGYSTWGMPTVPIDGAVGHLGKLGFDGIELTVIPGYTTALDGLDAAERRRIRSLLDRYNLELPAIAGHTDLLVADPAVAEANLNKLRAAVDLALDLEGAEGPASVNTTVGWDGGDLAQLRPVLIQRLRAVVDYAASRGVQIALEPHVNSVLNRPDLVKDLIGEIDSPFLRVNFDISHFNVLGMPIEESVPTLAPLSIHTHIKDERGTIPNYEFLIPGEGEFDYVRYLRAMRDAGYDGFITVEVSMMVQARPDYDPLDAATQSYNVLARAFQDAGIERDAPHRVAR